MNKTGYKSANCPLLDIKTDLSNRIVEGYFSAFNVKDADNDIILKGAFLKSIQEHGPDSSTNRKIAHLAYHDVKRPIGTIKELVEDEKGLYFRSELGTHTDGEDFLKMYNNGIIREHSIGFNYIPDKIKSVEINNQKVYNISEVKLWEGSAVVFGSNSETPNLSIIKSQQDLNKFLDEYNERMEICIKALLDCNFSEKFNNLFHLELQSLKNGYNSLLKFEPFDKNTQTEEPTLTQKEIEDNEIKRKLLI